MLSSPAAKPVSIRECYNVGNTCLLNTDIELEMMHTLKLEMPRENLDSLMQTKNNAKINFYSISTAQRP